MAADIYYYLDAGMVIGFWICLGILIMLYWWLKSLLFTLYQCKRFSGTLGLYFKGIRIIPVFIPNGSDKVEVEDPKIKKSRLWVHNHRSERLLPGNIAVTCLIDDMNQTFSPDMIVSLINEGVNVHLNNLRNQREVITNDKGDPVGYKYGLDPTAPDFEVIGLANSQITEELTEVESRIRAERENKEQQKIILYGVAVAIAAIGLGALYMVLQYTNKDVAAAHAVASTVATVVSTTLAGNGTIGPPNVFT